MYKKTVSCGGVFEKRSFVLISVYHAVLELCSQFFLFFYLLVNTNKSRF